MEDDAPMQHPLAPMFRRVAAAGTTWGWAALVAAVLVLVGILANVIGEPTGGSSLADRLSDLGSISDRPAGVLSIVAILGSGGRGRLLGQLALATWVLALLIAAIHLQIQLK